MKVDIELGNIVDKFYGDMNDSMERENIFTLWEGQRNSINDIVTRIKNENGDFKKIAIFGAGNCNDIDLKFLSSICKDITLFDIDTDALKRGIDKYFIEEDCKIELAGGVEFTGLYEVNFYSDFKKKLEDGATVKCLSKFIRGAVHKLNNNMLISQYSNSYDFVISMPVYTQLCYPLCVTILSDYMNNYEDKDIKKLLDEFNYLSIKSSKNYNDLLFQIGTESAKYFILTDVMEFTEDTPELHKAAQDYVRSSNFEKLSGLMAIAPRLSGTLEGIQDFQKRNVQFQALNYWIWPFTDERSYLVYALRVMKG